MSRQISISNRWSWAIALMALMTTPRASAIEVGPGDFSPGATQIAFDNLAGGASLGTGEIVTNQYAGLGATFFNPDYASRANTSLAALLDGQSDPNALYIKQNDGDPFGDPQQVIFAPPALRVGAYFAISLNSTITMRAYSSQDILLETITKTGVFDAPDFLTGFIGVQQLSGIARIELLSRSNTPNSVNFNFTIDDLKFESVPEPSGLLLLGLGLVGFRLFRGWASNHH